MIATIKDEDKEEFLPIAKKYVEYGYEIYSTIGTYKFLKEHGINAKFVNRISEQENTIIDLLMTGTVDLVIDRPTRNNNEKDGFLIRRVAVETGVPTFTSLDTCEALINCLINKRDEKLTLIDIGNLSK